MCITPQPGPFGLRHPTLAQPIGLLLRGSPVFRRRVRNVRRLQLVFLNLIYERIQLDMPCCASEPTSKPVQPQGSDFRPVDAFSRPGARDIFREQAHLAATGTALR